MRKIIITLLACAILSFTATAQKYLTKNGKISFYSAAPVENIEAINNQVNAVLDLSTGEIAVKVLMKSFEFPKSLMQEHFNEDYVESDKYPSTVFKGKIVNYKDLDISKNGKTEVTVEGDLTMKGITNKVSGKATLEIKDNSLIGISKFPVKLSDFNIVIPNTLVNNISKTIDITVNVVMNKLND